MTTYIDSSALVRVYVPERFSQAARKTVKTAGQIPFTQLHACWTQWTQLGDTKRATWTAANWCDINDLKVVRPARLERATSWFVASGSFDAIARPQTSSTVAAIGGCNSRLLNDIETVRSRNFLC